MADNTLYASTNNTQDGVHRWLVLASSCGAMVLDIGLLYSLGSLFLPIMEEFESDRANTAAVQSTMIAISMCCGIVNGGLVKTLGARKAGLLGTGLISLGLAASYFATSVTYLSISIGVVSGAGMSLVAIGTTVATEESFEAGGAKVFVVSLALTGGGIGAILYPYILVYLNELYGIHGTFLLVGAITANSMAFSLLWSKENKNNYEQRIKKTERKASETRVPMTVNGSTDGEVTVVNMPITMMSQFKIHGREMSDFTMLGRTVLFNVNSNYMGGDNGSNIRVNDTPDETDNEKEAVSAMESMKALLKSKPFIIFTTALALSYPTLNIPVLFLTDLFVDKGYIEEDGIMGLFILNVVSIVGRILPGLVLQVPWIPVLSVALVSSFIGALSVVGVMIVPNLAASLVMCGVTGMCLGMLVCMFTLAAVRLFGKENVPTAFGMMLTVGGVFSLAIGPLCGLIRDLTKSYELAFYLAAGGLLLASVLYLAAQITHQKKATKTKKISVILVTKL